MERKTLELMMAMISHMKCGGDENQSLHLAVE